MKISTCIQLNNAYKGECENLHIFINWYTVTRMSKYLTSASFKYFWFSSFFCYQQNKTK